MEQFTDDRRDGNRGYGFGREDRDRGYGGDRDRRDGGYRSVNNLTKKDYFLPITEYRIYLNNCM